MKILDACCGGKMFWYEKNLEFVDFQDNRELQTELCDGRIFSVEPDFIGDVTQMDIQDESYDMVVFDPPHLKNGGDTGWIILKYGKLPSEWLLWIERAFKECFRVLRNDGVLVFKWNGEQIPFAEVVKLSPYKPIFGDKRAKTRWTVFVKYFDVYEFKVIPFKPKIGDKYWWVEVDGKVCSDISERGCTFDCMAMAIGNCFRTKESAEAHKEEILKILKGEDDE